MPLFGSPTAAFLIALQSSAWVRESTPFATACGSRRRFALCLSGVSRVFERLRKQCAHRHHLKLDIVNIAHSQPDTQRIYALDAARGMALLLGIVLHSAIAYIPGPSAWPIMDESRSLAPAIAFYVIHVFRMLVFFVLAGFFANFLIKRVGTRAFAIDRMKRVAIPLLVFWSIVLKAIVAAIVWMVKLKFGEIPKDSPPGPSFRPDDFPLTHLWFLWTLLILYTAFLAARTATFKLRIQHWFAAAASIVSRHVARWYFPLLIALPIAATLFAHPKWMHWYGIPTPDKSLYGNLAAWSAYTLAFIVGCAIEYRRESLLAIRNNTWVLLALGTMLVYVSLSIDDVAKVAGLVDISMKKAVSAYLYAAAAWTLCLAFISLMLRFMDRPSTKIRYLSAASYWVYIVHLPVVMFLQVAGSQWNAGWFIEWPIVIVVTAALTIGCYHLFVRNSWIGVMLNGRRWRETKAREAALVT
jgi:glucans biosynthesis protein C